MDECSIRWDGSVLRAQAPDGRQLELLTHATVAEMIREAVSREMRAFVSQQPTGATNMSDIVSPVAGQPFVITDNDRGHRGFDHSDSALREAVAGQRESNAAFRAADADRSRNAIEAERNARDSERNHARTREIAAEQTAKLLDAVKAEAVATRELMHQHRHEQVRDRALAAEQKLAALYSADGKVGAPSL